MAMPRIKNRFVPRSMISKGALEGIREFLAQRKAPVTVDEVARIYPDLVTWVDTDNDKSRSWFGEAREWALAHLQELNRKKSRVVLTDGKTWRLASMNV